MGTKALLYSPSTPFNRRERTNRRKRINGHWVSLDKQAAVALAWLRAEAAASTPYVREMIATDVVGR